MATTMQTETKTQSAVRRGVTLFPKSVRHVDNKRILKPSSNNSKLGEGLIIKGRWKGMPIYSLTLEERTTCPSSCLRWDTCYGNKMPFAHRFIVDCDFYDKLEKELKVLSAKYPMGFVVRLHVLGDFPDLKYVTFWSYMLKKYPKLRIFGYTSHDDTIMGEAINRCLNEEYPDRCVIRYSFPIPYSGLPNGIRYASNKDLGRDSFICPEQTNKTESCLTCAACWQSNKTVYFKEH